MHFQRSWTSVKDMHQERGDEFLKLENDCVRMRYCIIYDTDQDAAPYVPPVALLNALRLLNTKSMVQKGEQPVVMVDTDRTLEELRKLPCVLVVREDVDTARFEYDPLFRV